jgi:cardiolipin synthase
MSVPGSLLRLGRNLLLIAGGALVLALVMIGAATLLRDARSAVVSAFGDPEGVPAATDAEFARTASLLTRTPIAPGTAIDLLLNGDGTFPRLWEDLRGAERSITVQLYYINPGALLDSLVAVLGERARAGVRTHFLYDAVGSDMPDSTLATLRAANVRVAVHRPVRWFTLRKAQNRSHTRAIIIDGVLGYTGGFGVDDRWLGTGTAPGEWRDTNARFSGPAVAYLQAAFVTTWSEATGELLTGELYFPPTPSAGQSIAGVLFAQAGPGSTIAERFFALTVASARSRLFISNAYFVPSEEMTGQLRAAARRGVDVRLLLPGHHTDVPMTRWAARGVYEKLLRSGVRIYEYQPGMMHAKTIAVDGVWSAVGTMNLDTRSFVHNDEIMLLAWDPRIGLAMERMFLADLDHAREVVLASFRERPFTERVRERMAAQLTRIL